MAFDHDLEQEKRAHPENFAPYPEDLILEKAEEELEDAIKHGDVDIDEAKEWDDFQKMTWYHDRHDYDRSDDIDPY